MSESSNRERDLVLAPNEYAFISDQTKGNVVCYVGPYKTSMANTDKPVTFDQEAKRFKICSLEDSTQRFVTAPEGWYVVLKNPSKDGRQPNLGTSNSMMDLQIGRKVNLPGPTFFALWPGQMAKVVTGHNLRSNQYLLVRVYEEEQARLNWNKAVIKPQKSAGDAGDTDEKLPGEGDMPALTMGQVLLIKGTSVAFYIPPTGIEVVRAKNGSHVREAVTLERLEYCILLDESGNKRYIKGPAVVFPKPTETFILKNGIRKFKAIELSENSGIYVKVIAPYSENGNDYKVGDELFITGKDQMIYYPCPEHALIKYGEHEIYHSIAIPPGEGRYCLNRNTGKISLQKGPCMLLPDPREAVIVKRILTKRQVELMFPGNQDALAYNENLKKQVEKENSNIDFVPAAPSQAYAKQAEATQEEAAEGMVADEFTRHRAFTAPRTITLDSKYDGAVTLDIWTGYAVLIVSKTGDRKVVVGPQTYLLEYDENLGAVELSTGTPKTDAKLQKTVYLRSMHNKVSDVVTAESSDFCEIDITLSYRVNFTGEPEKWFDVENFVKFLTDHLRSVIRNAVQKYLVTDFYANGIQILRDVVLGKPDENSKRTGRKFEENGMMIYDVEVLNIKIKDKTIESLLIQAQHDAIKQKLQIAGLTNSLEFTKQSGRIDREKALSISETKLQSYELYKAELGKELENDMARLEGEMKKIEKALANQLYEGEQAIKINETALALQKGASDLELKVSKEQMDQRIEELKAEVEAVVKKAQAVSPDLIAALQAFGDKALAEKMADSMAPLAIIGGKSIVEVFANLLKGTNLERLLINKLNLPDFGEE